jgi:hypothetical protein
MGRLLFRDRDEPAQIGSLRGTVNEQMNMVRHVTVRNDRKRFGDAGFPASLTFFNSDHDWISTLR